MERSQYKKPVHALVDKEILDEAGKLQKKIDKLNEDLEEINKGKKNLQNTIASKEAQVALMLRAQESGHKVYQLKGGEFTDEEPGSESQGDLLDNEPE